MDARLLAEIAIAAAALALWALALREAWRAWQPARLLLAGRYGDARAAAERLERSWMRIFPSVRLSARYAVGCARHLEGDFEGSLAALAPLHQARSRGNLRYAVCSIDAANLVLLERDPARAAALLDEAAEIHRPPEDVLLAAHARLALGDRSAAKALLERVGPSRGAGLRRKVGGIVLVEDRRQQEAIFHTMRGLLLAKLGRSTEAQRDFALAARSPVSNVYVERARAALQARAAEPDDPRSSLAPQIVTKETGER